MDETAAALRSADSTALVRRLSAAALAFWAKSPRAGRPAHQLLAHLLDAGACALALLDREPAASQAQFGVDLGLDVATALRWIALLCALHDLGKGTPAFLLGRGYAAGDAGLRQAGLIHAGAHRPAGPALHGELTQSLVPPLLQALGWQRMAARRAAQAIGAHHGARFGDDSSGKRRSPQQIGSQDWADARAEVVAALIDAFGLAGAAAPTVEDLGAAAFSRLAGCASVADWIASSLDYGRDAADAGAYLAETRRLAARRLDDLGWHERRSLLDRPDDFVALFPHCNPPNPLQQAIAQLLATTSGPALFVIEAPMGEGKTEAALYAHACLQRSNGHRGLYVALPTQATGNSAFARVRDFLAQFDRRIPLDLQLLHGAATLNADFRAIQGPPMHGIHDEDDTSEPAQAASIRAREWFTHSKRALLSEYGVGTVDQALLSVLNVRHYFVRLWGLANRVVVIDEVHAYDSYTGNLIATLLRWLRALGSSVIVMSATLPDATRARLLDAWGGASAPPCRYPRITRVDASGVSSAHFASRPLPPAAREVRIVPLAADTASIAAKAIEQTTAGGCVLIVVNTVRRAQQIYRQLRERQEADCEILLFHSRFPAFQRETIEAGLRRRFGRDGSRRPRRAILVSTQVCEQSLDVDFDLLISDLAPIDLILQRIGRMHRHDRLRPEHLRQPCAWVAGIDTYPARPALEAHAWHKVYNAAILLASAHHVACVGHIAIPDDIDALVGKVYRYDDAGLLRTADWPPHWQREGQELAAELQLEEQKHARWAKSLGVGDPDDGNSWPQIRGQPRSDDDDDPVVHAQARAATRLGANAIKVVFLYRTPLGLALTADGASVAADSEELPDDIALALYQRCVPVARPDLVRAIATLDQPRYLRGSPLLRQIRIVGLDAQGEATIGGISLRLDAELGLVS